MITEWFIETFIGLVQGVWTILLPESAPLGISVPSGLIRGYALLNSILPVSEAVAALGLMMTVLAASFVFRGFLAIVNLIRGSGVGA